MELKISGMEDKIMKTNASVKENTKAQSVIT